MAKKKTTRTRVKPKKLTRRFPKIDWLRLDVKRDPKNYDRQIRKMRFNDCNGRLKPKAHRQYIEASVELRLHNGRLFGRAFSYKYAAEKVCSSEWLPVALSQAHENELRKRKKVFFSFVESDAILFDAFYERLKKERKK